MKCKLCEDYGDVTCSECDGVGRVLDFDADIGQYTDFECEFCHSYGVNECRECEDD